MKTGRLEKQKEGEWRLLKCGVPRRTLELKWWIKLQTRKLLIKLKKRERTLRNNFRKKDHR